MDSSTNEPSAGFRPPYMAFQTFWNFIAELGANPLPPAIDRSMMTTKSGSDKANLTATLQAFGLTGPSGEVQPVLVDLTASEDREAVLRALIERAYPRPLQVSASNGTSAALTDAFDDAYNLGSADTRRKAITFFLHAARQAGIELSPHFPSTRSGSGGPGAAKPKRTIARKRQARTVAAAEAPAAENREPSGSQAQTVPLRSGGSVTVTADVNVFTLSAEDQAFFLSLVNALRDYQLGQSADGDD